MVESLTEAEARRDRIRAHEGARVVATAPESRGQGRLTRLQEEADVLAHAVARRVVPGQDRRVGGAGQGRRARNTREADTAMRQLVEDRGGGCRVAVGSHVIGPQGVDGDQQDVRRRTTGEPHARADGRENEGSGHQQPGATGARHGPIVHRTRGGRTRRGRPRGTVPRGRTSTDEPARTGTARPDGRFSDSRSGSRGQTGEQSVH